MDKVHTASTAPDAAIKRLFDTLQKYFNSAMDDFVKSKDVLKEARNQTHEGFEDLREERDALATKNWVPNVDRSEVLNINSGGGRYVHDQEHPDPDQGDEAGGYVQRTVGQAPVKGRGRQGVPGCQS